MQKHLHNYNSIEKVNGTNLIPFGNFVIKICLTDSFKILFFHSVDFRIKNIILKLFMLLLFYVIKDFMNALCEKTHPAAATTR